MQEHQDFHRQDMREWYQHEVCPVVMLRCVV